jgi:hypothetical protein
MSDAISEVAEQNTKAYAGGKLEVQSTRDFVLSILKEKDRDAAAIAAIVGMKAETVRSALERACVARLAHITAWVSSANRETTYKAVYRYGNGVDAPHPTAQESKKTLEVAEHLEIHVEATIPELAESLGMKRQSLGYHIGRLHRARKIHISGWDRHMGQQGDYAAVYKFGEGVDVPAPTVTRHTKRAYSRRYYENNRAVIKARRAVAAGFVPSPFSNMVAVLVGALT